MRRRQSLQVLDLENKLDQLVSENRLLQNAKSTAERSLEEAAHARNSEIENYQIAIQTRDSFLSQKDAELNQLKNILEGLQSQVVQLTEVNEGLSATSRGIADHEQRYSQLQAEHANTHQQWQQSLIELDELRQQHSQLSAGMEDIVRHEVNVALEEKNLELRKVHDELEATKEQVRVLQRQMLASKNSDDLVIARDEDYFDDQCQKLCQHVQQWVLRFSKFSDMRACYLASEIRDEVVVDRIENAILDGSDVDSYLADRVKRRDVFMSVVMTMIFDYIFTRYLFGMDREQRQKLKSLQNILSEVGPMAAVHKWRATTLTLLSRRQAFVAQRAQDTEAVMEEIYKTLAKFLPPPSHLVNQIQDSLRKVIGAAVDLHIEMRTQRAEFVMLPPLQPEYDTNGDLARKVYFNAALMNERSGDTSSNDALEAQHAVVRMVLFPLVVKRGDDSGIGDEEIVVCPAQVLTAKPGKEKKTVRVMSVAGSTAGARSVASLGGSDVGMGNMI
jgi:myosin heavy subunit